MDAVRIGLFTSSQNYRLVGTKKVMETYVKEKKRERKLGIEMNLEAFGYPLSWGRGIEGYVFEAHTGLEYSIESQQTTVHESGLFCGTKDLIGENCIADIKCPYTRTSFCDLVELIQQQDIELFKKENPEYYWQLVSNSVLEKVDYAELIVFMPYLSEIPTIIEYIELIDDFQIQKDIQWVIHSEANRIPFCFYFNCLLVY